MSRPTDPFELMRAAIPDAVPDPETKERARSALQAEIGAEVHPPGSAIRFRSWTVARLAVAAVVFSIAAISVSLLLSQGDAAGATLEEIAQAARQAEPNDIPAGGFLFQESTERSLRIVPGDQLGVAQDFAAYLLTTSRSTWRNPGAGFVQITSLNRDPQFFHPVVEEGYRDYGQADVDNLGRAVTEQFTDVTDPILDTEWPHSADDLLDRMAEATGPPPNMPPRGHQIFEFAVNMLAEPIDPALRAATIEVIGLTDPTSVLSLPDGSVRIDYEHVDGLETRQTVVIRSDGTLQSREVALLEPDTELGLPSGTIVASTSYTPWEPVSDLD